PALLGGVALTATIAAAQTNEGTETPAADAPAADAPAAEAAAPAAEAPAETAAEEAAAPAAPAETAQGGEAAAGEAVNPDEIVIDPVEQPYVVIDGQVDPHTYNGFRRYHNSCHVCHGPDGMGSSFAPALTESLRTLDYTAFAEVVVNGRKNGDRVMPSFGADVNVMEHMDDIYRYLKARSDGKVERGRPERIASK
ncbi:MAG TPA: c-type cytochrome, partial [Azospirillaceae bacterium]|nr:c-type cytochrome [Azospirillaceae bacterium]